MFITNEDLILLKELDYSLRFEESISSDMLDKLEQLIVRLAEKKQERNKINAKVIAERRKTNKFYAKSYKEKNKMLGI